MAFSFIVELLNMKLRKKYVKPVALRSPVIPEKEVRDSDMAN